MDQLIPIISKLQDVLGALGNTSSLDLPQIVVVGGQSSGKSSVLEAIVGRSFLPRGHGIVTRRPLVLQLFNTRHPQYEDLDEFRDSISPDEDPDEEDDVEWGEFLHLPGKRFFDFTQIRREIIRDTDRLTGSNKGIDSTPIHLKIHSPHVLSLTMVDLPGIAKVAVGDQPVDIEQQIRDMCMEYITNPNAIILAVTSANTDLANSDALKLAHEVDPYGERTLGVLTKLDLMDQGTDASEILHNKVIPLRKGYIGVVNRGQLDVESDLSIREGLRKEKAFFRKHPTYGHDRTLSGKLGTENLARVLNATLMHHIRECLPELKNRLGNMLNEVHMELEELGTSCEEGNKSSLGGHLLSLLSKFVSNFSSTLEGKGNMMSNGSASHNSLMSPAGGTGILSEMNELFGGARISFIFNDIFSASLMGVESFDGLTDEEIRTTICNANGTRPSLFVPEMSFDILARRQISRLEQPGLQCVDLVYEELQRIASQCEPGELTRFPNLRDRLVEVVNDLLKRAVGPTQMMVSNLIKIELAYINTSHPDFIGGSRAVAHLMRKLEKEKEARAKAKRVESVGGATPLTTSSLQNYSDKENHPDHESMPVGDDGAGGILNFVFGRGKTPNNKSVNKNIFRTPNGGVGGPPSIVQLPQVPDQMRQTDVPPTDREKVEMEIIKSLIDSYFSIVRKNFIDMVPKTIMYFLVNHVRDAMQNELVSELYRDSEIYTLMTEADDVAQRRKTCEEMKEQLAAALEILNEVRDFNAYKTSTF
jgi:dynamin 1-like protein